MKINHTKQNSSMFTAVFSVWYAKLAVFLLLAAIFVQPVSLVYAAELEATVDTIIEPEPEPEQVEEEISESEEVIELNAVENDTTEEAEAVVDTEIESGSEEESTTSVNSTNDDAVSGSQNITESTASSTLVNEESEDQSAASSASTTDPTVEINTTESTGTSTTDGLSDDGTVSTTTASSTTDMLDTASGSSGGDTDFSDGRDNVTNENQDNLSDQTEDSDQDTKVAESTENDSGAGTTEATSQNDELASTTSEIAGIATSTATSTEEIDLTVVEVSSVTNDSNYYQFGRGSCVSVGDGSFYCGSENTELSVEDSFYAAPDAGGDMEIFVTIKGETSQITYNQLEDKAPQYDALSNTLVWHRLINGRYHIMSYDFDTAEETKLTDGVVNNMEPARFGDMTVWQRWVLNNWEIVLLMDGEETLLTDNDQHDIAPTIRGEFIMWNTIAKDGQQVLTVYDTSAGSYTVIDDADGTAVVNPRMVLLYDKTYDNGDVVTQGYDLITGKIVPLGAIPAQLPEELPDSDQTGETRALIQQKTISREDVSEDNDLGDPVPVPKVSSSTPTEVDDADLVIAPATSTDLGVEVTEEGSDLENTADDEIEEIQEKDVSHIEDVVIVAQSGTTTESTVD